jgi:BMFP domain-containing protein YqiC
MKEKDMPVKRSTDFSEAIQRVEALEKHTAALEQRIAALEQQPNKTVEFKAESVSPAAPHLGPVA